MGVLDALADMMIVGRSKGVSMCLGFQSINGLYSEYGVDRAKEILGCTGNIALLRINPTEPDTSTWASQVAGQLRYKERKTSETHQTSDKGMTSGTTTAYEYRTDSIYIPSFFSQKTARDQTRQLHERALLYQRRILRAGISGGRFVQG